MSTAYISTLSVENAHEADIYALAVCESYTVSTSGDGKILLWDNRTVSDKATILNPDEPNKSGIHHVAVDADGKYLSAVYFDGSVHIYDLKELKELDVPEVKKISGAWGCAIASLKSILAVSTVAGEVVLVDLVNNSTLLTFNTPSNNPSMASCVDITVDAHYVACGLDSGKIHVYSTETGRLAYTLPCHTMTPRCVKFSPNSTLIAVSGDVETISLFSLNGGDLIDTLVGHHSWIFGLDWSETGEFLLSVSQDSTAKIWSLASKSCVSTLNDSTRPLFAGAWIRKGWGSGVIGGVHKGVVTAGFDQTLRWYREAAGNK